MREQEQIKEMVSIMAASNNPFVDVPVEIMPQVAIALYNAGYRKAEEVRKETAKEFAEKVKDYINDKVVEEFNDMAADVIYLTIDIDEFEDYVEELLKEYEE